METVWTSKGYRIPRDSITYQSVKRDLTIFSEAPQEIPGPKPRITAFKSDPKYIYVPYTYGLKRWGKPKKRFKQEFKKIDLPFSGKLRDYQEKIIEKTLDTFQTDQKSGLWSLGTGLGKCLGIDTPVMMYDGTIKMVQDIKNGDKLMGDDSECRNVLSLARGKQKMFEIKPNRGESYIVNKSHILSLKSCSSGNTIDISVEDYIEKDNCFKKEFKGYRVSIYFPEQEVPVDPYILGIWLGNNLMDTGKTPRENNELLEIVEKLKIKRIPYIYKCNSLEKRLRLLRGIIDTNNVDISDTNLICKIVVKNKILGDDIIYLCRSLGFNSFLEINQNINYEVHILKKEELTYDFEVIPLGVDNYYGFEIDNNRRFVLGDFTVTHNTAMALYMISELKVKTLIMVHKKILLDQWIERIKEFLPKARIGVIQGPKIEIEDKDIVIGMVQTMTQRDYPFGTFKSFGSMIIDECFHYGQGVITNSGIVKIGVLYEMWENEEELPLVMSFNEKTKKFEYKKITYAWEKDSKELLHINYGGGNIKCTECHKILTPDGYKRAQDLKIGNLILCKTGDTGNKCIVGNCLNDDQYQLLLGSFLGDGCVITLPSKRYRLSFIHGEKQKSYLKWKSEIMNCEKFTKIENNGYSKGIAYTSRTKIFDMKNNFPPKKNKCPQWIIDDLDYRGLAIWWMDDGSVSKNNFYGCLSTCAFDEDSQQRFVEKFKKLGIDCSYRIAKKNYYSIYFKKEGMISLIYKISPYIHESMLYKIKNIERKIKYEWSNKKLDYGTVKIKSIEKILNEKKVHRDLNGKVYDIEVKDNHNFVLTTNDKPYGPIVHNCHNFSAKTFNEIFFKIQTKYALGLSATIKRKDGFDKVLVHHLGDILYEMHLTIVEPKVTIYHLDPNDQVEMSLTRFGKTNLPALVTDLGKNDIRNSILTSYILDKIKQNRKILVLSDRVYQCERLHEFIQKNCKSGHISDTFIGKKKKTELEKAMKADIILATYGIFKEGVDCPKLDTLIFATPKTDITQAIGRILRQKNQNHPEVIDIVDSIGPLKNQYYKRNRYYKAKGYNIVHYNQNGELIETSSNETKNKCFIREN